MMHIINSKVKRHGGTETKMKIYTKEKKKRKEEEEEEEEEEEWQGRRGEEKISETNMNSGVTKQCKWQK